MIKRLCFHRRFFNLKVPCDVFARDFLNFYFAVLETVAEENVMFSPQRIE